MREPLPPLPLPEAPSTRVTRWPHAINVATQIAKSSGYIEQARIIISEEIDEIATIHKESGEKVLALNNQLAAIRANLLKTAEWAREKAMGKDGS